MALLQLDQLVDRPEAEEPSQTVEITPSAVARIKTLLVTKPENAGKGLRLYVTTGGCAGYSYGMAFDESNPEDIRQEIGGLPVLVDPESWRWLKGVKVDFQESLLGSGFSITNPNAASTCGCGTSFSKDENAG